MSDWKVRVSALPPYFLYSVIYSDVMKKHRVINLSWNNLGGDCISNSEK